MKNVIVNFFCVLKRLDINGCNANQTLKNWGVHLQHMITCNIYINVEYILTSQDVQRTEHQEGGWRGKSCLKWLTE